jgi:hypothetical protein
MGVASWWSSIANHSEGQGSWSKFDHNYSELTTILINRRPFQARAPRFSANFELARD